MTAPRKTPAPPELLTLWRERIAAHRGTDKETTMPGKYDYVMNHAQCAALGKLCERFGVPFDENNFKPVFDLPEEGVAGWIGTKLYVGCDPEGRISS